MFYNIKNSGCAAGYRLVQLCCRLGGKRLYGYMVGMAIAIKSREAATLQRTPSKRSAAWGHTVPTPDGRIAAAPP